MTINKDEFIQSLEDFLLSEEAKQLEVTITGEEEQDSPMIDSLQKANYFLKAIKKIDEDMDNINTFCDEEIQRTSLLVNEYRDSELKKLANQRNYLEKLLKNFTEHELENSSKKSIKLPNGTLSIKKQQPVYNYDDDNMIEFLTSTGNTDYITTKIEQKIDKTKFKKALEFDENGTGYLNGVAVPELSVEEREDKFTIK